MAKKKQSKQKKINVRVDFTPMVDMLMLLITFFMLCTTLSKPSSMELFLPSNDKKDNDEQKHNEAKADRTITLYVAANDKLFYGKGIPEYDNPEWLQETTWSDEGIRDVLRNHTLEEDGTQPVKSIMLAVEKLERDRKDNPQNYNDSIFNQKMIDIKGGKIDNNEANNVHPLTIVIKLTDNASYQRMIDALNEMQILSIGTYVIDKINPQDEKMLKDKNIEM
jgi:biopolymer transport protein ExbD